MPWMPIIAEPRHGLDPDVARIIFGALILGCIAALVIIGYIALKA